MNKKLHFPTFIFRNLLFRSFPLFLLVFLTSSLTAQKIQIDINAPGAPVKSGFTAMSSQAGSTLTTQGVKFTLFGYAANNYRDRSRPSDLLRDFAFNERVQEAGIGFRIENLPAGTYSINSWHYDATISSGQIKVEYRKRGQTGSTVLDNFRFGTSPAIYTITSDGSSTYELIFRENDNTNRARFNGITLNRTGAATTAATTAPAQTGNTNALQLDINAPGAPVKSGYIALGARAGSTVTTQGVKFTLFGYAANNYRDRSRPSELLRDFAFNEGVQEAAVGLRIENLPVGTYRVNSWHYDATISSGQIKVEYRKRGQTGSTVLNNFRFGIGPATYTITSDGSSTYELIFRENDGSNRTRFNGIKLEQTSSTFTPTNVAPAPTNAGPVPPNTEVVATDGVWTWFNDERAIFHQGFLYSGYVFRDGRIGVTQYNPTTKVKKETVVSTSRSQDIPDDHNNPSFTVLPNNHLLILYSRHANRQEFYYRISNTPTPTKLSDWSEEKVKAMPSNRGHTYVNTYRLQEEGNKIYNFSRNLNFDPTLVLSNDNGQTWGTPIHFIKTNSDFKRPYVNYTSNLKNRIDLIYTDAHPDVFTTSLYHMYYTKGSFKKSNGTHIRSLNTLPILHDGGERGSVIYNYTDQAWGAGQGPDDWIRGGRAWTWDIEYQANGNPVVAFQVRTNNRIYYYYAKWNGSSWKKKFIAQGGRPLYSGQPNYGGGMTIDPKNPNIVYISTNAANPLNLSDVANVPLSINERYEIWKGITTDGGNTFKWTAITSNSPKDNLRPIVPPNHTYAEHALWFYGDYISYLDYKTQVIGIFNKTSSSANTTRACDGNTRFTLGNGSITINGRTGQSYSFQVFDAAFKQVFACITGCGSTQTATGLPSGKYRVLVRNVTSGSACMKEVNVVRNFVENEQGSSSSRLQLDASTSNQIRLYPNPAVDQLNIQLAPAIGKATTILLLNNIGQLVQSHNLGVVEQKTIDLPLTKVITSGIYQVLIQIEGQETVIKKLMVNR